MDGTSGAQLHLFLYFVLRGFSQSWLVKPSLLFGDTVHCRSTNTNFIHENNLLITLDLFAVCTCCSSLPLSLVSSSIISLFVLFSSVVSYCFPLVSSCSYPFFYSALLLSPLFSFSFLSFISCHSSLFSPPPPPTSSPFSLLLFLPKSLFFSPLFSSFFPPNLPFSLLRVSSFLPLVSF